MANKLQKSIIKLDPYPQLVEQLQDEMIKSGGLKITGLGVFKIKQTKGTKNGYNPYSKKRQHFKPKIKVLFKPAKSFNDKLQKCKI